jgi:methylmalonyl-CoA/ethylmalonyl-CoA epimerase
MLIFVKIKIIIQLLMNVSHIEHIGIAVVSLETAIPYYESLLGTKCYAIEEIADQKVKTAFFKVGETKIELLESTDPEGPIGKFIDKKGPGVHHLAFAVPDVNFALEQAKASGIELIDQVARDGAEGLRIGFLHPKSTLGVLTEICGEK